MLGAAGAFDSWLGALYFGMSIPGSMYRAAGTVGRLWGAGGGAATAIGGAAGAAAGVASAGAGLATGAARSAAEITTPPSGGGATVAPRSEGE